MNHPGILQIGRVTDNGETITVHGWAISTCMTHCGCHRDPVSGGLNIAPHHGTGALGLASYRPCQCCTAWTVDELGDVLRDLAYISGLQVA